MSDDGLEHSQGPAGMHWIRNIEANPSSTTQSRIARTRLDLLLRLLTGLAALLVCMWWLFFLLRSAKNYYFFRAEGGSGLVAIFLSAMLCGALCGAAILGRRALRRRRVQYGPFLDLVTACLILVGAIASLGLVTQAVERINPNAARCSSNFACSSTVANRK